jgi:hypothetical protein
VLSNHFSSFQGKDANGLDRKLVLTAGPSYLPHPRAKQDDLDWLGCGGDVAGYFLEAGFGEKSRSEVDSHN